MENAGPEEAAGRQLRQAARYAWLALDVALADPAVWGRIAELLPAVQEDVFRQHAAVLLDLLTLAGLKAEDSAARRPYRDELRAGRQSGLLPAGFLDSAAVPAASASDGRPEGGAGPLLDGVADGLRQAGYPHLAHLACLRSPPDGLLLRAVGEYFLSRARGCPPAGHRWRCLETMARLFDSHADLLEELLDDPEAAGAAPPEQDAAAALFQEGLEHYHNGDYRQALARFTAALKFQPADAVVLAHRGNTYQLLCEFERAIADFSAALELSPQVPSLLVSRAAAFHLSGEHNLALADCDSALALNPGDTAAHRRRAAVHSDLGAFNLALADFNACLAGAPNDVEALQQRGVLAAKMGEFGQAIADFNRVLEGNPNYILAYLHRGHAHRSRGDYAQAVLDYSEVLRRHSDNAQAYLHRGVAHELQGATELAIVDYTEALRLEPGKAHLYCSRGILHRRRGELVQAQNDFDEALRLQPENWAALYHRGRVRLAAGQLEEALADFDEALHLNPKLAAAYLGAALILNCLGDPTEAVARCGRALQLQDESAGRLVRGLALANAGNAAEALADLTRVLELDPQCGPAHEARAALYMLQGKYDLALADYNHLLALEPRNAHAYANRCGVYQLQGDEKRAALDFSRAMQLDASCMVPALAEKQGARYRRERAQRLAEYVEGQRTGTEPGPPPRPAPFLVARAARPADSDSTPPTSPAATREVTRGAGRNPGAGKQPAGAAPPRPRPKTDGSAPEGTAAESLRATEQTAVATDSNPGAAWELGQTAAEPETVEICWEEIPDKEPAREAAAEPKPAAPGPGPVCCPICRKTGVPAEALPDGRLRCASCRVAFLPAPVTAPPRTVPVRAARPPERAKQRVGAGEVVTAVGRQLLDFPTTLTAAAAIFSVLFLSYALYRFLGGPPAAARPPAIAAGDRVTVARICERFRTDQKLRTSRDAGWPVTVTGEVEEVDWQERIVYLKREDQGLGKVACHLVYSGEVGWSRPGQPVTITGSCQMLDPQTKVVHLNNCLTIPK